MRLPPLPRRRRPLRRRKHGDRRGAARPGRWHGRKLLAAVPLRPALSVPGSQRACGPLRSHGDRAAWARRRAATDGWSRRVHEHEVTYAVAAPVAAFGSLRNAYHAIHERIAAALRSLGADATLAPHQPPPSGRVDPPASCFATPVGGEVLVTGRKLVGSAQVRKRGAFLQHGSILLDGSQAIIAAVSRMPHVASAATTLFAELGRRVTWDEVVEAILQAWRDEGTSPNLHQPPPTSTTSHLDLAPLGAA